jgi:outer membrane protein assembly factor BamB
MPCSNSKPIDVIRRWAPAVIILVVAILAIYSVQTAMISITGKPSRDVLAIIGLAEFAVYIWVRLYSGLRLSRQVLTLVVFIGLQGCLYAMIRHDGFYGDGRPRWAWRWTPSPEALYDASRMTSSSIAAEESLPIDMTTTAASDYPSFRGRDRRGHVKEVRIETDWQSFPPKLLWRRPIGRGWSSFAVVGEHCVTQEQRGADEAIVCYELRTGTEVWVHRDRTRFDEATGGPGPRATPAIHDGNVYALGATGLLNCLDGATGKRLWSVDVLSDNETANALFGMTGSPLVLDQIVVVSPGGERSSLVAYDLKTGERVWKGGSSVASYSSPAFAILGGREQILNFNGDGLFGHDAGSGKVLWSLPWISNPREQNNVCQPVVASLEQNANCVLVSSGYGMGSTLLDIRESAGSFSCRERWRSLKLKAKFSSVVVHAGYVFGLDGPILTCLDLRNGKQMWNRGRYGYGQLLLIGSTLLVQLESGEIALVEATPDHHVELARFAALDSRTWNHPVFAGRFLLLRNDREAAVYELAIRN